MPEDETIKLQIRVPQKIKEQSEKLFDDMGINTTTAVNVFLRTVIREEKLPFEIFARKSNLNN